MNDQTEQFLHAGEEESRAWRDDVEGVIYNGWLTQHRAYVARCCASLDTPPENMGWTKKRAKVRKGRRM